MNSPIESFNCSGTCRNIQMRCKYIRVYSKQINLQSYSYPSVPSGGGGRHLRVSKKGDMCVQQLAAHYDVPSRQYRT